MSKVSFFKEFLNALSRTDELDTFLKTGADAPAPKYVSLKTDISKVHWIKADSKYEIEPAKISIGRKTATETSWFDELFEGSLKCPESISTTLTMLIKGDPGTGKTTLATELCYRLTNKGFDSIYYSTDSTSKSIMENANSFGWDIDCFLRSRSEAKGNIKLVGKESIFPQYYTDKRYSTDILNRILEMLKASSKNSKKNNKSKTGSDIIVIDNLNILENEKKSYYFENILKLINGRFRLAIFIVDSKSHAESISWEYICDNIIELSTYTNDGYLFRGIEILKARYQPHVWGKHQLKIYPAHKIEAEKEPVHPYINEGGIFIYPSIHWFLSKYKKRKRYTKNEPMETPLENLNRILGEYTKPKKSGGLPRGRCTALVGDRGTHKSHLGYYHILNALRSNNDQNKEKREKGLIISLRDDEILAKDAMISLLVSSSFNSESYTRDEAERLIEDYIANNDLEILFFPPGYITPEEFYNKVLLSLMRLKYAEPDQKESLENNEGEDAKKSEPNVTVLFNSLDQLSARFPLCAKEAMFIPGLIDTFNAESTTSIFIAVDEQGQPSHQFGLLTMSDLILRLCHYTFPKDAYFGHLEDLSNVSVSENIKNSFGQDIQTVLLTVERFAGGQRAGYSGILELVQKENYEMLIKQLFQKESRLIFIPLSPNHSFGRLIRSHSTKANEKN